MLDLLTPVMVIFDLLFLIDGNYLAFFVTSAFLLIFVYVQKNDDLNDLQLWTFSLVYFLNVFAFMFDFYKIRWFDDIAHTLTPYALVIILGPFLYKDALNKKSISWSIKLLILTTFGVFLGVIWEVWEFYADIAVFEELTPTMHDTITDIIFDTLGSLVAAVVILTNE